MKILIFLLLICFPALGEVDFSEPTLEVERSLDPVLPKEFTTFIAAPNVSVITGDYQEEACDLIVEGIEPLFFRRFYNHLGGNNPIFGHWRIFPEWQLYYNFDFDRSSLVRHKKYAVVGEENGSAYFCNRAISQGFGFDKTEKGFIGETGQTHPLNISVDFNRYIHKENCYYTGTVREGNGALRTFVTDRVPYKNDVGDPNVPPYQARVLEYRRPNGNILVYECMEFNELMGRRKAGYQQSYVVTGVTAYNRDKTKILGWIKLDYRKGKNNNITSIEVTGSDGRKAELFHTLRVAQTENHNKRRPKLLDVVLQSVETPNKPKQTYEYHWEKAKHYFDSCFLYQTTQNGACLETLYDQKSKKVLGQNLPLGKQGEWVPTTRYSYQDNLTTVLDGENQKTLFRYNPQDRITSIEKYEGEKLYYIESNTWDPETGNLLKKEMGPLTLTYLYDAKHNPIEEKITDGKESYTLFRTYSDDGFNLKLSETDGSEKITRYTYVPDTNLLASEIVYEQDVPKKRTFHTYDDCAVLTRRVVDDGQTVEPDNLQGVTYRKITNTQPKSTFPCFGLPEIVEEKTLDAYGNEVLLRKVVYHYYPSGQIAKEEHYDATNTHRYTLENQYSDQELLICKIDAKGNQTHYSYDDRHNLISLSGPNPGQYKEIHYDKANRPIEEKVGDSPPTKKRYNTLHQVIATTDESGYETHFAYNVLGQVKEIIHPDGGVEKKEYDSLGNLVCETDPNGNMTQKEYNLRGLPTRISYADGTFEAFTYYPNGNLRTRQDKQGAETHYTYDIFDHPLKEETYAPDGTLLYTKSATWSPFNKLSETDEEGITTTFTYDFAGRKIAEKKERLETKYQYDALGRLTHTQKPGATYIQEFDLLNRVTEKKTVDAQGILSLQEKYRYDAEGNQTHTITCLGVTETLYNAHKQPIQITDPAQNITRITYTYQEGFTKNTHMPDGVLKIEKHDPLRRLSSYQVLDPQGLTIQHRQFLYDLAGNRTHVLEHLYEGTTPTQTVTTCWHYGPNNRLEHLIEAETKETTYHYDAHGRLSVIVKPDQTELHHTYDACGRLKTLTAPNIDYSYSYDKKGRLTSVSDKTGTTTRTYDTLDNLTEETLANGYTLRYNFDPEGKLVQLTLPDKTSVSYTYQGDKLKTVTYKNLTTTYERNLAGKPTQITLPSQLGSIHYSYDPSLKFASIESKYFTASDYQYISVGDLTHYTQTDALGTFAANFTYDHLHQLLSEDDHTYAYDSLNNRIQKDNLPHTLNSLSQVTHDGETTYRYDLNGNLIQAGAAHFTFDALNRLTSVTQNGQTYTYLYDPFNRRITKKTPNSTIHYIWQNKNEIGSSQKELRILGEGLGAEIGAALLLELNNQPSIPFHDHRGAIVTLIDLKGNTLETFRYTAYGEELTQNTLSPWRFCSKRLDPETGFLYFGRRYYSPPLGRWISPDPRGFEDGPNLYAYVHNTPLLTIDLYGEYAYQERARYYGGAALDFAFPCGKALYNLPPDAPMWKRGALAFGAVGEAALLFVPGAKVGVSLAEKAIFQVGKSALVRQSERELLRTAGKTGAVALENKIIAPLAKENQALSHQLAYTPKTGIAKSLDLDALSKSGQVLDREGLTKAGRALDKHGNRPGSVFPKATGNPASKNMQGQFHLDDILTDPKGFSKPNNFGGMDFYRQDGSGVRFYNDGTFRGFLEPNL